MPNFHEASKLAPSRLNSSTPLGYFRSLDRDSNATELLIVEKDDTRFALVLAASDPRWIFDAVPLRSDDVAWTGVSLGPVEVLVDLEAGQFVDQPRYGRGAVTIHGGRVYLAGAPSGTFGERIAFDMGPAVSSAETTAAIFGRWQLIQRDPEGRPIVLYELA